MQRHHRPLAEADEEGVAGAEPGLRPQLVEETGEHLARPRHAGDAADGAVEIEREPLVAERVLGTGLGRVGRDEQRLGQRPAPVAAEVDEVVAVGAVAVQQDHELAGHAARRRRQHRAGKFLRQSGVPSVSRIRA
jgi:hypothetical protein